MQVLDGERATASPPAWASAGGRDVNVTRIGWVARMLASHGVIVLVPVIAPYAEAATPCGDHARVALPAEGARPPAGDR